MSGNIFGLTCGYEEGNRGKTFVINTEEKHSGKLTDSEIQMLKNYEISGILPLEVKYMNYRAKLCYEINGKNSLAEILNTKQINLQEYIKILLQILKTVDSSKKYFLNENNYVLDINYIFITADFSLSLVYLPLNDHPTTDALSQIRNTIVPLLYARVNNQDAILAKKIFDDFLSGQFSLSELISQLNKDNEHFLNSNKKSKSKKKKGNILSFKYRVIQIISLVVIILSWASFVYFMKSNKKDIALYVSIGTTVLALISLVAMQLLVRKSRIPLPIVEVAAAHEDRMVPRVQLGVPNVPPSKGSRDTVALHNATSALSKCACLIDNNGGNSINLDTLPLIIGRGERIGSYLVVDTAISGKHARIEKDAGRYLITDLESTNKTFVNGKILNPHQANQLKDGDLVCMGRTDFVFHE